VYPGSAQLPQAYLRKAIASALQRAALDELLPGWRDSPPPICVPAGTDEFWFLSKTGGFKAPINPPQMNNHGNVIVSLGAMCAWLAPQCEAAGVEIYPGFAASEVLYGDDGAVCGVRIGDMGVAKEGSPKATYTQGIDIKAKTTVLGEGARGHLSKQLIAKFKLDADCDPQSYSIGIKELWQVREGVCEPGKIVHSMGWPADSATYGGSFLYHLDQDRVYVGFVVGLDYEDPRFQPFEAFQQFKNHPTMKALLDGGEILAYGARTIVEGGWQSMPTLEMPGALLVGDAGGTLNVPKIKGIHQAIRSGALAAEHVAEHDQTAGFDQRWRTSAGGRELHKVRNIRPGFRRGLWAGMANGALETLTAGHSPWTFENHADHSALKRLDQYASPDREWVERQLKPRDRVSAVFFAGNTHEEAQPAHLKVADTSICATRCAQEYGNPCQHFCPAHVYEMVDDGAGGRRLQINASNCVHCKACDIKDPYEIITWTTPEGGSGPSYQGM